MHQLTEQVKLLQKAIIVVGKEFLILKRAGNAVTRALQWDLAGGNCEWPSSNFVSSMDGTNSYPVMMNPHLDDLVREVMEETGIKLDITQIDQLPVHFSTVFEPDKQLYTVIVGWKVTLPAKPSIVISHEHTQFTWITHDQFDQYDFGFAGSPDGFIRRMLLNVTNVKEI